MELLPLEILSKHYYSLGSGASAFFAAAFLAWMFSSCLLYTSDAADE